MTDCADCGRPVTRQTVRTYIDPNGTFAKVLCQSCQTSYPRSRQYQPSSLPNQSTYTLEAEP